LKKEKAKILYSPENIKISFVYCQNPQGFDGLKSPSPPKAGWDNDQIPERENSILVNENKFETECTAAGTKPPRTFTIILPNLIHKSRKKNLKRT